MPSANCVARAPTTSFRRLENRPLRGRGILVTRPAGQAQRLAALVEAAGGRAILFPAIEIEPLAQARLPSPADFDLVVFVSPTAVQCAAAQDYGRFYAKEIEFRKLMHYPPFGSLASVIVRSSNEEDAITRSATLGRLLNPAPEGVRVMGPAPAAVARVKTEYRFQILLKTSSRVRLNEVLGEIRRFAAAEKWNPTMLAIDVDPVTLL